MNKLLSFFLLLLLLFSILFLASCGASSEVIDEEQSKLRSELEIESNFINKEVLGQLSTDDMRTKIGAGMQDFSNSLLQELFQYDSNLVVSPYSAVTTLSMTSAGAVGPTKTEMKDVLGVPQLSDEELHTVHMALIDTLNSHRRITLHTANSIWHKKGVTFNQETLQLIEDFYEADVKEITNEQDINDWVAEKTNGNIENIVEHIDPQTMMFLLNTVYFLAEWHDPFISEYTVDKEFHTFDGSSVTVPFMTQGKEYKYDINENYEIIRLPYRMGKFSMEVLLPSENSTLEDTIVKLNSGQIEWTSPSTYYEGSIHLPKFSFSSNSSLTTPLKNMGMKIAMDENLADFSNLSEEVPLFIDDVLQNAFITVDEEGTEAGAVTVVEMAAGGVPTSNFHMNVNRPFLFRIIHEETGVVMFIGNVVDPSMD
ncbi:MULTISPECIES: serpin family protein [Bacillaceae]|uniref:Serpin family protein n=1 Tax=Evansella alkalicola TaxID=745819 RepID=A0ABS6JPE1_9BACI|nr:MULTISPECIES: serpin family protein [Bacillaceae]MBU9719956.1 serpin family protein [Bacillus alkalicola]